VGTGPRPTLRAGFIIVRLHDLFVAEHARRQGIGRALFEDVVGWARERGATYVQWHGRSRSAAFYDALGVQPTAAQPEHPFYELQL
jgi:GNAT superfamily N-acetyltransferase